MSKFLKKSSDIILVLAVVVVIASFGLNNIFHFKPDSLSNEKRELAKCPQLPNLNEIDLVVLYNEFEKTHSEFEKCFDDNFSFRNKIVKEANLARVNLFQKAALSNVAIGQTNWFYYDTPVIIDQVTGTKQYTLSEKYQIKKSLLERKNYFEKNKIKYYQVVVPSKLSTYPQNFVRDIKITDSGLMQEYTKLAKEVGFEADNLKKDFDITKSQKQLFHTNDSHWNYEGLMTGYNLLTQKFANITKESNLIQSRYDHRGDIPFLLNIFDSYVDKNQLKYTATTTDAKSETEQNISYELSNGHKIEYQKWNNPLHPELPVLVLFGDSFTDPLRPILAQDYSELYFFKTQKYFPVRELDRIKPDQVIYMFNEFQLVDISEGI